MPRLAVDSGGPEERPARARKAPPILARQVRAGVVESVHRGHVVQADAVGRLLRVAGDPDVQVALRSCAKPFALVAFVEAGGVREFDLTRAELAVMAASHSGEDLHVRTILAILRRAGVSQALLACGAEGMPLDALTAARLARDGERPGPIRHMCSGHHASLILLARMADWPPEDYWRPDHPVAAAMRSAVGRVFGVAPERLVAVIDGCGIETFAFRLREVARAFALLSDPLGVPQGDPRLRLAPALTAIRDAMVAHPDMVAGTRDRLDTSVMKALPGRIVSKGGAEALRGFGILPTPGKNASTATAVVTKIDDGDGCDRATWSVGVEALRQVGVLEGQPLRVLARYHRPTQYDPHGRLAAETIAEFDLAPVGELLP